MRGSGRGLTENRARRASASIADSQRGNSGSPAILGKIACNDWKPCGLAKRPPITVRIQLSWKTSSLDGNGEPSARGSAPAEAAFAALTEEKVQQSEELYLVSAASDANVKIRDGLLDIKLLEHVDSNGLEQWKPVIKEPFPLKASAVAFVTPGPRTAGGRARLRQPVARSTARR